MNIGLIGLGKMGYQLALNMRDNHIDVVAYNRSREKIEKIHEEGVKVAYSLEDLVKALKAPRVLWLMVPSGDAVDQLITQLLSLLDKGDMIIDGGNSNYKQSLKRFEQIKDHDIGFVDVGTSGGTGGARLGACMMIGASQKDFDYLQPVFEKICVKDGYSHVGPVGAGHYVKMIHNGVEYAMMQAIGEGFEILEASPFDFDHEKIAKVWNNGSIIESYLMGLAQIAFSKDEKLDQIVGKVNSSGEGLWTLQEALDLQVPVPTIADSIFVRYRSHQSNTFSNRLLAALRNEFGGHAVEKVKE